MHAYGLNEAQFPEQFAGATICTQVTTTTWGEWAIASHGRLLISFLEVAVSHALLIY